MTDKNQHDELSRRQVASIKLPPEGTEPSFLDNPVIDQLMETIVTLGAELWTERDHRYRLEALLQEKNLISGDDLKNMELDEASKVKRDAALAAYVKRIFEPLKSKPFDPDKS